MLRIILTFLTISLVPACAPEPPASDPTAITNRPQQYDRFIAIARLSEPALLTSARGAGRNLRIDSAAERRLNEEQEDFLASINSRFDGVQVIHRYRFVLNGVVIAAPVAYKDEFTELSAVSFVESAGAFAAVPATETIPHDATTNDLADENSATFIGAGRLAELTVPGADGNPVPITGRGLRIGVIDTGIDYTHAALGGTGRARDHENNDPNRLEDSSFPNAKVVGGIDLVGATYNAASPDFDDHIPQPDDDPLDIQGHGTHVAGTIAGLGDNEHTYNGVARDAELYAIKVFSDGGYGSTSDHIVIAALEYAVDPNQDGRIDDRLDVVNLSLGSSFGTEHILYEEALTNMVEYGGIVAACSAGNSGDQAFIVGAPSTVPAAISVAASVDETIAGGRLTDTLASFSSRGPRSLDGAFKPEIAAPGYQILSAGVGGGTEGVRLNGTSMAAPHIAGVAALMRQVYPDWSAAEIKDALLNTAVRMADEDGRDYPLALQGSGRVDVFAAATTKMIASPATLSLGVHNLGSTGFTATRTVTVKNLASEAQTFALEAIADPGFTVEAPDSITVGAGSQTSLSLRFTVDPAFTSELTTLDATIKGTSETATFQVHSLITARQGDSVTLVNARRTENTTTLNLAGQGDVQVFTAVATDDAEPSVSSNPFREDGCDLSQVGYRVITKDSEGTATPVLQIAVALKDTVTSWHVCEVSVLVDRNGDGEPESELLGTYLATLSDRYENGEGRFFSFLMDADRMVAERRRLESRYDLFTRGREDYIAAAMVGYRPFYATGVSRVAVVEVPTAMVGAQRDLEIQVATLTGSGSPGADDRLQSGGQSWFTINSRDVQDLTPETLQVDGNTEVSVATGEDLMLVAPNNQESGRYSQLLSE